MFLQGNTFTFQGTNISGGGGEEGEKTVVVSVFYLFIYFFPEKSGMYFFASLIFTCGIDSMLHRCPCNIKEYVQLIVKGQLNSVGNRLSPPGRVVNAKRKALMCVLLRN